MRVRLIAACGAVILLSACATLPVPRRDAGVVELIELFNTSAPADFIARSGVPFLFAGQVLYAEADLEAVLTRLRDGGLYVDPGVLSVEPVGPAPQASRFDVAVFFEHLPPNARAIVTASNAGEVTLIVGGGTDRTPMLFGLLRGRL